MPNTSHILPMDGTSADLSNSIKRREPYPIYNINGTNTTQEIRYTDKITESQGLMKIWKHRITGRSLSKWNSFSRGKCQNQPNLLDRCTLNQRMTSILIVKLPIQHNYLLENPESLARFWPPACLAGSAPNALNQNQAPVPMMVSATNGQKIKL